MGEARKDALRVEFDRSIKIEFHGSTVSSDGGLLPYRDLDEAFALTAMANDVLTDLRTGRNIQHSLTALGRLARPANAKTLSWPSKQRLQWRHRVGDGPRPEIKWKIPDKKSWR